MKLTTMQDAARPAAQEIEIAADTKANLPFVRMVAYGSGQLVELVIGSMLNIFVLFYVTAVCGLPGGLAGLALGAGLVIDAFLDPMIGSMSDSWRSRWGRRVPFMVFGIFPLLLTFNLIFALPESLTVTATFIWLTVLSVSLRISLSIFYLPYSALGAELTDDYNERSSMAAWRWGIGIIGTLAVVALGFGVFFVGPEGMSNRAAYLPMTLTLSVLVIIGAIAAISVGLATRHQQHAPEKPEGALHQRLIGEVAEMFRNRTFLILFGSSVLLQVTQGVSQALGLHSAIFFWHLQTSQMPILAIGAVLGLVLGAPLAGPLSKIMEKRTMLVIGFFGLAACQTAPVILRLLDLLPFTGDALLAFLGIVAVINGVSFTFALIAFLSIIPDATDEHELLFGARREGLYFAGWSFAGKCATGAGLLIAGIVLQVINFPSNVSEHDMAGVTIPEQTANWLGIAGGPGCGLIAIIGVAIAWFYHVDKKAHARIKAELTARRSASA